MIEEALVREAYALKSHDCIKDFLAVALSRPGYKLRMEDGKPVFRMPVYGELFLAAIGGPYHGTYPTHVGASLPNKSYAEGKRFLMEVV